MPVSCWRRHRDSAYVQMLTAETFAEQRAFIQAERSL